MDRDQSDSGRVWVEITQTVDFRVDVTDHVNGEEETPEQLVETAIAVFEYHEMSCGDEVECTGYGYDR